MIRFCVLLLLVLGGVALAFAADDATYQLGPQDKITVTVLRHTELSGTYTVPPDGMIDFPRVGQVNVIGKTIAQVTRIISEKLSAYLKDPEVSVVVAEPRLRNFYVLGSVAKPGLYTLGKDARITELVAAGGGLIGDEERLTGSLVRGKETIPVDLQRAKGGDPAANLLLQEGDVLWVKAPELMTIVVAGQVKAPGSYRLELGSRLLSALAKAGDLIGETEKLHASIMRGNNTIPVDLQAALSGKNPAANVQLHDGDLVMIQAPVQITVVVSGQVKAPGVYKLDEGSRVLDAVAKAGDLVGKRETLSASLVRGNATLPVKLQAALSGLDREANMIVQDGDSLVIQAPPQITVTVMGQVKAPGMYQMDEGSNLVNALTLAGDLTERPERITVKLVRRGVITEVKYGDNTVMVQNNDVVSVERESMVRVYVNGHVKAPGAYDMVEGGGVVQAITLAGGTLDNPSLSNVKIVRVNGETQIANLSSMLVKGEGVENPILNNGDQVIVIPSAAKVMVFGGVARGGTFAISETEPTRIMDVIGLAGGPNRKAKLDQVVVIRDIDPTAQKATRIKVNVNEIIKGKIEKNITLQPGDVVYVPDGGLDPDTPVFITLLASIARFL